MGNKGNNIITVINFGDERDKGKSEINSSVLACARISARKNLFDFHAHSCTFLPSFDTLSSFLRVELLLCLLRIPKKAEGTAEGNENEEREANRAIAQK